MLLGGAPTGGAAPPVAGVDAARALLADCGQHANPDQKGLEALSADCPGLGGAIHDLGLEEVLPQGWQRHVSARALSDWSGLASRYARASPQGLPDPVSLQGIARSLPVPVSQPTEWERFWKELRDWYDRHRSWWPSWLRYPSSLRGIPGQTEVLLYGLIALLVLGAGAVVFFELRAAGVLGRMRSRRPVRPRAQAPRTPEEDAAFVDLEAAPPHLRPVLLLRMLVELLSRSRRLEHERIHTCRELVTSARFDTDVQRERFAALALLAERGLYGAKDQAPAPQQDAVLAEARGLEGQLGAPAGPGAA
jgi:hypothetical protein